MHRQSTEFASLLKRSEYRTENICQSIYKNHLTFQASSGQRSMIGRRIIFKFSLKSFILGFTCFPENRKQLNLQVEATHVELIPRSSRDANYAIKRCCSPSYFPFSDYSFQIPLPSSETNQCKLRPRL